MATVAVRWALVTSWSCAALLAGATAAAEQATDDARPAAPQQVAQAFRASSTEAPRALTVVGPDQFPPAARAIFIGATGGLALANFKHPDVASTKLVGPMLSFQVGYRVSERWAVSVVYSDFQRAVSRAGGGELFAAATSLLRAQADCTNCKPPVPGGDVLATTFRLSTVGPAVDVSPFGKSGPFLGASGGVAMATLTSTSFGYAGTARAGLRVRPVETLSLGIEGGVQGQKFDAGSALIAYGGAELRLRF